MPKITLHKVPPPRLAWMKNRHAHKGYRGPGVRVFYLMAGTEDIYSDIAIKTSRNVVRLLDGGWLSTKDTYFTAGQCRRANGLWTRAALEQARHTLDTAMNALGEADARMRGIINSIEEARS